MTDSQTLFAEYVQTGSDAAFRELVARYVDLVYSTALRLVAGDTHRAEDVAQIVFLDLVRVARTLPRDVRLGGWLHRDTCLAASTLMRGERRRQSRERQAVEMNALQNNSDAGFSLVAPILDDAINELGEADRTAILLRFFEQHDFRSVGQALGSNEDAARMRVARALDKLEGFLKRRGVTTTAASLVVALSANAVQVAPVGLAATISTAAALAGTIPATATAAKIITMTTLQKTLVSAALTVAIGIAIHQALEISTLRTQVQELQQALANQTRMSASDREEARNQVAGLKAENDRLNRNTPELLRLRGEVNRLRKESANLGKAAPAKPAEENTTNAAPFQTFSATNHVELKWGQTVVTGGWQIPSGNHVVVFATPTPGDNASSLKINVKIVEIAAGNPGLLFGSDSQDQKPSLMTGILDQEQYDSALNRITQSGASTIHEMSIDLLSGHSAQIQSGASEENSGSIDVLPVLSDDGKMVDLNLTSTLKYPTAAAAN